MSTPKLEETRALMEHQKSFLDKRTLELHESLDMGTYTLDRVTYLYNRSALLTDLAARAYADAPAATRTHVIHEVQELVDKLDHAGAEFSYSRWTARYTDSPFPRTVGNTESKGSIWLVKQVFDIPILHWVEYRPHGMSAWRITGGRPSCYYEESIGQPWPEEYTVAYLTGDNIPDTGLSYAGDVDPRLCLWPHVYAPNGRRVYGPVTVAGLQEDDGFRHDFDLRVAKRLGLHLSDYPFACTHDRYPDDIQWSEAMPEVALL